MTNEQEHGGICPRCGKRKELCVCTDAEPFDNRIEILILQHPQEQDKDLGTAGIMRSVLKNCRLEIALSRPGLSSVLERSADPKRWGVLYLGAQNETPVSPGLYVIGRKGQIVPEAQEILKNLEGIVLLDGSWSQAKALWWRNPWLLKLRRLVLVPERRSLYGKLRKEPRRESVSTLEAAAESLSFLGEPAEISQGLLTSFSLMLEKYKALCRTKGEQAL